MRPSNTGGSLTHGFAVSEELPDTSHSVLRGYLRLRERLPGGITNNELRTAFGSSGMSTAQLRVHLDDLKARNLLTYKAISRGEYTSFAITLLDNEHAAKLMAQLQARDEADLHSQFVAEFVHLRKKHMPGLTDYTPTGTEHGMVKRLLREFGWNLNVLKQMLVIFFQKGCTCCGSWGTYQEKHYIRGYDLTTFYNKRSLFAQWAKGHAREEARYREMQAETRRAIAADREREQREADRRAALTPEERTAEDAERDRRVEERERQKAAQLYRNRGQKVPLRLLRKQGDRLRAQVAG